MKKYKVQVGWSGYSRGHSTYEVEAESEEEAMKNFWYGIIVDKETTRDDTESEAISAEEVV